MLKRFLPNMYQENIFKINYKKLKKQGIKCLLFDLDNTISPAKEVVLENKTKKLFDSLKKDFKIILFSNNFPKRVSKFGSFYDVDIACISLKPSFNLTSIKSIVVAGRLLVVIKESFFPYDLIKAFISVDLPAFVLPTK